MRPLLRLVLLCACAAASLAKASAPAPALRWASASEPERAALHRALGGEPLPARLLGVSAAFLGTPYVASPLGEGSGIDPDPSFRLDAVDCLTFVEETIALSLASRLEELEPVLAGLRYAGAQTYEERNHLMESQWLPNNLRKGFLADVTRRYGGDDATIAEKVLTRHTWTSLSSRALNLPRRAQPVGSFALSMIPLARVMAHARAIPSGTVMVVLREDLPLKATRVTHLGFIVQKRKRTYLRHAARGIHMRVVDEDLETFLARASKYARWKVTGVALYEVRQPSELREALVQTR